MRFAARWTIALAAAVWLSGLTGCYALEELDKANSLLAAHSPKSKEPAPEPAAPAAKAEPGFGERMAERGQQISQWWNEALEDEPVGPDPDDVAVRCQFGDGGIHFLRKSDCELRGGRYPGS